MKYKAITITCSIMIAIVIFNSCKSDSKTFIPNITGALGEVLIIMDKAKWDDSLGITYLKILAKEQEALNQSEPLFDVLRMPHSGFNNFFKTHRNIIINNISPEYKEAKIVVTKDKWAKTQLLYNLYAPNDEAAVEVLQKNSEAIVDQLWLTERNRLMDLNKKNPERTIYNALVQNHDLILYLPKGYTLDVDSPEFVWISQETMNVLMGIFIYHASFDALKPITPEYLIKRRNAVLKENVPGGPPGSYMTTEMLLPPVYSEFLIHEKEYHEIRGLWTLEKGFMGGPFISITTVDEERKRLITVEGYVYAPNRDKRNYMRQVEAVVYSLELPE